MTDLEDILSKIDSGAARGDRELSLVQNRGLSLASETAPFLLFLMGDSVEQIAEKTSYPKEIIAITARKNEWVARKTTFTKDGRNVPAEIQRNLVNAILATTYVAVIQELAMVQKGERDPAQCKFVPKNVSGLQTLMQMVHTVNQIETKSPSMPPISGDKVQVNINMDGKPSTKAELLKAMADAADEK